MPNFAFEIECDALSKSKIDGRSGRFIGGYVSTDHMDRQGETLIQKGLDFSHFLEKGWFNDNHSSDSDSLVGYPTAARLDTLADGHAGWYVEGELLPEGSNPRADKLWGIAEGLAKGGGKRRLGFSVEGGILERDPRDPSKVRKAVVREVAITRCPVNTQTSLDVLAKSLSVGTPSGEAGSAAALEPEALEGIANAGPRMPKKRKPRKMRKSAAVHFLRMVNPKLSVRLAERVVGYAAKHYPTTEL